MRSYLRMMLFALGLLAGVQIPGLIDLYYQRLDARLQQADLSLAPFQGTADRYFGGDLAALVDHYSTNPDPVFAQDAASLQHLVSQQQRLQQERAFQDKPWYQQLSHLLLQPDPRLWQDTLHNYSYVVPLKQAAIFCGVVGGLLAALLGDLLLGILWLPFRPRQPAPRHGLR
ncbi:Protein of uncharacterised function (DUF2937) [Aeromonas encheleia]|uniref:DUF2937 family protein n=1 Tax=Aeromonas encheleia TaxID=73010 RepID=UPI0005B217CD|nr:DUF2937 family protein [Aeromonas encheleia]VEG97879.1 Protein of uncharacterised function (DUF2937) [Aeromonas encheleia]